MPKNPWFSQTTSKIEISGGGSRARKDHIGMYRMQAA